MSPLEQQRIPGLLSISEWPVRESLWPSWVFGKKISKGLFVVQQRRRKTFWHEAPRQLARKSTPEGCFFGKEQPLWLFPLVQLRQW